MELLGLYNLAWVVNVELELRHYGQVVPELSLLVGQVGEHATHDAHDGLGALLALFPVLDGERVVHHLLYRASVFGQRESFLFGIVFHHNGISFNCSSKVLLAWLQ